jgi:hypothetical protein
MNEPTLAVGIVMQVLVSIVLLAAALLVILSKRRYDARAKHWAYATVGLITGFWLKR